MIASTLPRRTPSSSSAEEVEGDQPDLAGQTFVQQGPISALRRIEIDGENRVDAGMPDQEVGHQRAHIAQRTLPERRLDDLNRGIEIPDRFDKPRARSSVDSEFRRWLTTRIRP